MILSHRKIQINKLAELIANNFIDRNQTQLDKIAEAEDVPFYFDNYEDAFDGMLLYDGNDFHIHINLDKGNTQNSKRGRFTFAHELGHFFLDEHRLGLKYGLLEPHASFHNLNQKSKIEEEADYFASCLLMPEKKFKTFSGGKRFSLNTLFDLSENFQSSLLSTLIRFGEVGTHEIFAVISKDNKAKWFVKSLDFPNWKFKFEIGRPIPHRNSMNNLDPNEIEKISVDDWFITSIEDSRADRPMNNQCYYSKSYEYLINLMWFD